MKKFLLLFGIKWFTYVLVFWMIYQNLNVRSQVTSEIRREKVVVKAQVLNLFINNAKKLFFTIYITCGQKDKLIECVHKWFHQQQKPINIGLKLIHVQSNTYINNNRTRYLFTKQRLITSITRFDLHIYFDK